ncbi:MAG: copper amine oxidase N-terminal domain-containing protein [Armatimonadota bacterium]
MKVPMGVVLGLLLLAAGVVVRADAVPAGLLVEGATQVPLRYLAGWLGATINYNEGSASIEISVRGHEILLSLNSRNAYLDDKPIPLKSPPLTASGVAYVPLRFVTEAFGAKVAWDAARLEATVTDTASGKQLVFPVRPYIPGWPAGYLNYRSVIADFDGDRRPEVVYAAVAADEAHPVENPPPAIFWALRGGRMIWRFVSDFSWADNLQARDLTGDGRPELLITSGTLGNTQGAGALYLFRAAGGTFKNIAGTKEGYLGYSLSHGGVSVRPGQRSQAATLVRYDALFAPGEGRYAPHRYWAEWYAWKTAAFQRSARKVSMTTYGSAIGALEDMGVDLTAQ